MKSLITYLHDNAASKAEREVTRTNASVIIRKGSANNDRKNSISQTTSSIPSEVIVDNSDSNYDQFEFLNSETRKKRNSDIAVRQVLLKARIVGNELFVLLLEEYCLCDHDSIEDLEGTRNCFVDSCK